MELGGSNFLSGLLAIVLLDLVLAGDNAIVIALAARNLPRRLQKKAVLWGTLGAVAVRLLLTAAMLFLLSLPGLMLAGRRAAVAHRVELAATGLPKRARGGRRRQLLDGHAHHRRG